LTDGSGTTTINDDTRLSATNRPSLASTSGTNLDGTYTYARDATRPAKWRFRGSSPNERLSAPP
jgi:hypothetical protein